MCIAILLPGRGMGQSYEGQWVGWLSQDGKRDTFTYQVGLEQKGDSFQGESFSATANAKATAQFQVIATAEGEQLVLQEIQQLSPKKPKWCLKYVQLNWSTQDGLPVLFGKWQANGCTPGTIWLQKKGKKIETSSTETLPFEMTGKWTGVLKQSDRDYGFYYAFELYPDQLGQSYIVSEANGGSATHELNWSFDAASQQLTLTEQAILEKSDGDWRWCIKSGTLKRSQDGLKYTLEGPWQGYLEGSDGSTMNCAPGILYLEKPILQQEQQSVAYAFEPYEAKLDRKVQVERLIEVQSETLRIKIWDNGTVDGDVVTIFLNGEQLVENFKVTKRKRGFPVKINTKGDNYLILHAEDLGDISPNTVAVSIDDGTREQVIILSSNLEESGALMIRKFQMKE
ncbi:MAG: hypothetical protein AAF798_13075 [Bacteroidota bacterium]